MAGGSTGATGNDSGMTDKGAAAGEGTLVVEADSGATADGAAAREAVAGDGIADSGPLDLSRKPAKPGKAPKSRKAAATAAGGRADTTRTAGPAAPSKRPAASPKAAQAAPSKKSAASHKAAAAKPSATVRKSAKASGRQVRYKAPNGAFCRADTPGARAVSFRANSQPRQQARFLDALAASGVTAAAARVAGVNAGSVYRWRAKDLAFARAWDEAREAGYAKLEQATLRKLLEGSKETTIRDGEIVSIKHSHDLSTAARLVMAHRRPRDDGRGDGNAEPGKSATGAVTPIPRLSRAEIDRRLAERLAPYGLTLAALDGEDASEASASFPADPLSGDNDRD